MSSTASRRARALDALNRVGADALAYASRGNERVVGDQLYDLVEVRGASTRLLFSVD